MRRDACVEMNRGILQRCRNDISPRPKIPQALIRRRSLTLAPFEKGAMRRGACVEMSRGILQRCKCGISIFNRWKQEGTHSRHASRIRETHNRPQGLLCVQPLPPRAMQGARIRQAHNRPQGLLCVQPHPLFRNPAARPLMVRWIARLVRSSVCPAR